MSQLGDSESPTKKTYFITGSTDGIGRHTAVKLAADGHNVIIHGRSPQKLKNTEEEIFKTNPQATIRSYCRDLADLSNVKILAQDIIDNHEKIDCFINNAGIFAQNYEKTVDGLESTFAVNVAASFALSLLLLPVLRRTKFSRMINVSSTSQNEGNPQIILDNLQFEKGGFSDHASYSLSKLCVAAYSRELALRIHPDDCLTFSCDPGDVNTRMLAAGWPGYNGLDIEEADDEYRLATVEFDTSMHGQYFVRCRPVRCNAQVYIDSQRISLWNKLIEITSLQDVQF